MRLDRGRLLILGGVLLFVVTMAGSATLAPDLAAGGEGGTKTLVGSQAWGATWHEDGRVYGLNESTIEWEVAEAGSYFDVERTPGGTIIAAYADPERSDCGPYDPPCGLTGYQRIDPDTAEAVEEYSFRVDTMTNSEVHAVESMGYNRVALLDMDRERLVILEDGEVTWQWNASSFYTPPADPTQRDWLHLNDVNYLGDDRFLVSVRNANQLLVVDRWQGVVEVINEDRSDADDGSCLGGGQLIPDESGDVRCGDPSILNHQHNPHWLGDGAVLVADSENDRVVELHRTDDGAWRIAWSVSTVGDVPLNWPRDADRLPNGRTLITDTYNGRIVEITENGSVVWSTSNARIPYEADRLPVGERIGVPLYGNVSGDETLERGIPILSTATQGLHSIVPGLPYWVGEVQVLVTALSLGLVIGGVGFRRRG